MMNGFFATSVSAAVAVGDPNGARTVMSLVAILVAIGVALLMIAVWMFRTTRPDPELLAPLEVMGDRAWRRGDAVWQRRRLDEVRPPDAVPLKPSAAPPELDADYETGPTAPGFDDFEPRVAIPAERQAAVIPSKVSDRSSATPNGISRFDLDIELGDGDELPPDALAAAMAELDAELGEGVGDEP
jgi:hypothetical protein